MDITAPDKLRLVEGTTEVASLATSTGTHGQVLGSQLVCRGSDGNFGVIVDGGVEGASGGPDGGRITARNGSITITDRDGKTRASLFAGDELSSQNGGILALHASGDTGTGAAGETGAIVLNAAERTLVIHSQDGTSRVELGAGGDLKLGGGNTDGELEIRDKQGSTVATFGGSNRNLVIGGGGADGDLRLRNSSGDTRIHLDAGSGNAPNATATVYVDGFRAAVSLGNNGKNGDLSLLDENGNTRMHAVSNNPSIKLMAANGDVKVLIDGEAGDIVLPNADCAEDFPLLGTECPPGTVMVIDADGALRECTEPYDRKVAGVLSGAGDLRPGLVLGRSSAAANRKPLALVGKVYCRVDASYAPIEIGDLLTTSSTPGHAMRASDPARAFGAVIGKALRPLASGTSLIPILVALQ